MKDLLSPPMTEQICYYLVPAISMSVPLSPLLDAIINADGEHTIWTLYSVLLIFQAQFGKFDNYFINFFSETKLVM